MSALLNRAYLQDISLGWKCKQKCALRRVTKGLRHSPLPYTGMAAPVTSFPASLTSHTIKLATDAGCTHCEVLAPGMALRFAGVSIVPGKMTFAVIPTALF